MKRYKEPDFQERITAAARARTEVLTQLRAKPPVDEAEVAARAASRQARDAAKLEQRQAARLLAEEAKAAKRAQALEAAAAKAALQKPELTEAERKAARDARYMARKNRKA
jgi:predicted transcriptional regulator